ncbi:hypothetical protein BKK47_08665 [Rodentibacter mrazii]|uniref:Beta galactosidase small chain/ domain-containing protein n=1 Tax=Rodentibacter mrazii TaxID=1908257 RepID=A0A1V3IEP2_9PAST|nr:hypothetical protein [Rodentibacter mrazii]OOF38683.1 hypothetical protein BKK47_08665 [Rodentibacter mrazii]
MDVISVVSILGLKEREIDSRFHCDKAFSFSLSPYTQEELGAKKHHDELEESGSTILCVDYKMSSIGFNS